MLDCRHGCQRDKSSVCLRKACCTLISIHAYALTPSFYTHISHACYQIISVISCSSENGKKHSDCLCKEHQEGRAADTRVGSHSWDVSALLSCWGTRSKVHSLLLACPAHQDVIKHKPPSGDRVLLDCSLSPPATTAYLLKADDAGAVLLR